MLYLVNEQPYIRFENFGIDFDRLYFEATEFMVRCPEICPGSNGGQRAFRSDPKGMIHPEEVRPTPHDLARLATFKDDTEKYRYAKIVKGAYYPWSIYPLNEMRSWAHRQDRRDRWFDTARIHMSYFIEVIESLPFVAQIGWARIYANEPFNFIHLHVDHSSNIQVDQFVYFNLCDKKAYLMDQATGEKVYLRAKALFFDAANLHGTDPEPRFSFSIRVDCKFEAGFLSSLKLSRLAAGHGRERSPRDYVQKMWRDDREAELLPSSGE